MKKILAAMLLRLIVILAEAAFEVINGGLEMETKAVCEIQEDFANSAYGDNKNQA